MSLALNSNAQFITSMTFQTSEAVAVAGAEEYLEDLKELDREEECLGEDKLALLENLTNATKSSLTARQSQVVTEVMISEGVSTQSEDVQEQVSTENKKAKKNKTPGNVEKPSELTASNAAGSMSQVDIRLDDKASIFYAGTEEKDDLDIDEEELDEDSQDGSSKQRHPRINLFRTFGG
mgnify:CR=1 FL=1|tara:strand:+ start:337 stop:873 length:537 start_codon:yes stop_codon:yes gene_type:complete